MDSPNMSRTVPVKMAADMAAAGGIEVQRALVVPVGRDLRKTLPYDRPVPALKFIQGGDFTRGDILCKALQRRGILRHEVFRRPERDAARRIELLPRMLLAQDQGGIQHCSSNAVREALSRIAHRSVDILSAGIAADKACVVDSVEHLSRPAMGLFA